MSHDRAIQVICHRMILQPQGLEHGKHPFHKLALPPRCSNQRRSCAIIRSNLGYVPHRSSPVPNALEFARAHRVRPGLHRPGRTSSSRRNTHQSATRYSRRSPIGAEQGKSSSGEDVLAGQPTTGLLAGRTKEADPIPQWGGSALDTGEWHGVVAPGGVPVETGGFPMGSEPLPQVHRVTTRTVYATRKREGNGERSRFQDAQAERQSFPEYSSASSNSSSC